MNRERVLALLREHEYEFRAAGVRSISLFGSVARGEKLAQYVDVAVRLNHNFSKPGLDYFGRLDNLERRFQRF